MPCECINIAKWTKWRCMIFILTIKIEQEEKPRKVLPGSKDTNLSPQQVSIFLILLFNVHVMWLSAHTSMMLPGAGHHIPAYFHCPVRGLCANIPGYQNPWSDWKYEVTIIFQPFPMDPSVTKLLRLSEAHTYTYLCVYVSVLYVCVTGLIVCMWGD